MTVVEPLEPHAEWRAADVSDPASWTLRLTADHHLELDDATVAEFAEQLQSILDHVALLDGLDLDGVPPTRCAVETGGRLREDVERLGLTAEQALANAPDAAEGHFRVPRVLGE